MNIMNVGRHGEIHDGKSPFDSNTDMRLESDRSEAGGSANQGEKRAPCCPEFGIPPGTTVTV